MTGGVARVGAGTRVGELCERLIEYGSALPTGTCPSVGIAGLTLGGGLGILGRAEGLTLDHLLAAQVVLADGRIVDCHEDHHPDLFWALRGAGAAGFGVATSFTFAPRPAPRMTNFRLTWSFVEAAAVITAWQRWVPQGPDELSADLVLTAAGDPASEPLVEVYGAVVGSERGTGELLRELTERVGYGPLQKDCRELSYGDRCRYQAELSVAYDQVQQTPHGPILRQGFRFTKSELFDRALPSAAIETFLDTFAGCRARGQTRGVGFAALGGMYNRRSERATVFAHRDQLFSLEHLVVVEPAAPAPEKRAAHEWLTRSWASLHPWASGRVYPGFEDAELDDWERGYYGGNYVRLREIKASYDPDDFFHLQQSIPLT